MKKTALKIFCLIAALSLFSCANDNDEPRLVVITFDGLRWQEVYNGADSFLITHPDYVEDIEATKQAYWRATPEERREVLMPFTWSYIKDHGCLIGNRDLGSQMQVANIHWFSYPGYSETFCGYADNERITSNDAIPNPNVSVLEVANRDPRYHDSISVYTSWDVIPLALNSERGEFPANEGKAYSLDSIPDAVKSLLTESDVNSDNIHLNFDHVTCAYALNELTTRHPKVLYVAFGATDECAHSGRYDQYLDATQAIDNMIKRIVETCEADPYYKGKTTYLITTDHGRGYRRSFQHHGAGIEGAQQTWLMAFGKGIKKKGETSNNGPFYNQQVAATIAQLLGIEFTPDNGEVQLPITPDFKGEPIADYVPQLEFGDFPAVDFQPTANGVRFNYYEGEILSVDQIDSCKVLASGVLPNFIIDKARAEDHFAYTFDTWLKVSKTGRYYLTCTSDDGSKMWIDDKLVFDADGSHAACVSEAYLNLEEGYHHLFMKYFEDYEGQHLKLTMQTQDMPETVIPDSLLFYK